MPDATQPTLTPDDRMHDVFRLYGAGRFDEALRLAEQALAVLPREARLFNIAGASAFRLGRQTEAEKYFGEALRVKPDFDPAYFGLAILYAGQGLHDAAERHYRKFIELKPDSAEAWCNLGMLYTTTGRSAEAERAFRRALEIHPDFAVGWNELGVLCARTGRNEEAGACFAKALALRPDHAPIQNDCGYYQALRGLHIDAERHYRQALTLDPSFVPAHYNYGRLLAATNRQAQGEVLLRKAISLDPSFVDAYAALGNLYKDGRQWDRAEICYRKVMQLRPGDADAASGMGALCLKLGRFAEAEAFFRKALALAPNDDKTFLNYSFLLLLHGRFEEGWPMYEARYRYDPRLDRPVLYTPKLAFPQWQGESLAGKSIILWHEQGFGDMIQFARYVRVLKNQGAARVAVMCKRPLVALMRTLDGIDDVLCLEAEGDVARFDYWVFPLSIPLHCRTRLDTIPAAANYLSVPAAARAKWRGRVRSSMFKVGIVWKGFAGHVEDADRSLENLEKLRSLWAVHGVEYFSLQKGEGAAQAAKPPADMPLTDLGAQIEDFADAAAAIEQLDLVITVDTATAHLAGALGKPVWVLTRYVADWRWLLNRETSPWYPTLRLFRQPQLGNWGTAVEHVRLALLGVSEQYWKNVLARRPKDVAGLFYLGATYHATRRLDLAETCYRQVLALEPDNPVIHGQLGNLLRELDRLEEAEACYRRALQLEPRSFVAHNSLATLYKIQKKYQEAEKHYKRAAELTPQFADAYNNLGNLYLIVDRLAESEACYRKAQSINPGYLDVYNNLGLLYKEQHRYADAEACYRKGLALEPGNPKTMFMLGIVLLAQGQFEEGWKLFETPYRYDQKIDKPVPLTPFLPFARWQGEDLTGKSLLLWYEQGLGDVIQFARYAAILKQRGAARISLMCKPPLKPLLETAKGVDRVLSPGDGTDYGAHDYWSFIMSCPLYCGTRLDTIPGETGYISTPQAYRDKWRGAVAGKGLKVGLVWKGSTDHKRDAERSLDSLAMLAPLWDAKGVSFVSLQKGQGEEEAAHPPQGQALLDLGSKVENFADVAAIVEQLDLVICVDTAIAHLAGALGKPVWLLVQYTADWRWLIDREDTPWYPHMRLFRQQKRGDWAPVIARIHDELGRLARA